MNIHLPHLDDDGTKALVEPHPVGGGNDPVSSYRAEDDGAELMPLLCEVMGVDLGKEDRQDHGQHGDQVHLPPVLVRETKGSSQCSKQLPSLKNKKGKKVI